MPSTNAVAILNDLAAIGITKASLDAAIGTDPFIRAAVIQMTEKVRDTWQQMWDEAGPHPYQTGAYRGSLTIEYETKPSGYFNGVVRTRDRKAFWLEYGTDKMREFAPARRTIEALNGKSGTSKNDAGYVGT